MGQLKRLTPRQTAIVIAVVVVAVIALVMVILAVGSRPSYH